MHSYHPYFLLLMPFLTADDFCCYDNFIMVSIGAVSNKNTILKTCQGANKEIENASWQTKRNQLQAYHCFQFLLFFSHDYH